MDPPVPIPNTEVKRCRADGSASIGCARVGRCQDYARCFGNKAPGFFLGLCDAHAFAKGGGGVDFDQSSIKLFLKYDNSIGICSCFVVFNPPAVRCFGEILHIDIDFARCDFAHAFDTIYTK